MATNDMSLTRQVAYQDSEQARAQVDEIMDEMERIYNQAAGNALDEITAQRMNTTWDVEDPDKYPQPSLSLDALLAKINALAAALLRRPTYPTFGYVPPELPALSDDTPALSDVVIPDAPSILVPEFTAQMEDEEVILPNVEFIYDEIPYASALHDRLYNLLYDEMANGGYGLNANDEALLFERAREREQRALQGEIDAATRLFSAGGFSMPTGSLLAAVQRAQSAAREKISSLNRELTIQRGDLYFKGKEVNQRDTLALETIDTGLHNAARDRALKAAAQKVTSMIEISSFQLERLKIFLAQYQAEVTVFESNVKAMMARADIYGKQIDAVKAQVDINKAILEEFIARNKAIVDVFLAQVEEYRAQVDGYTKYVGALSDQYKADAAAFGAASDGYGKAFDANVKAMGVGADYARAQAETRIADVKFDFDATLENVKNDLEAKKITAQNAAMVAAAAISAMNVNATMSAGSSISAGYSGSESISENYSFQG